MNRSGCWMLSYGRPTARTSSPAGWSVAISSAGTAVHAKRDADSAALKVKEFGSWIAREAYSQD